MGLTRSILLVSLILAFVAGTCHAKKEKDVTELQIGVKLRPKACTLKAKSGDKVAVHYRGALTDGTVFDESYGRGQPIEFKLGMGQVIKGWDQGISGMCIGEKRKLRIPSKLGYGDSGSPPKIPGGATLVFDTELVSINGVKEDPASKTVEKEDPAAKGGEKDEI